MAATERREGTLAERQRLAIEIHDTLAQGLSSQRTLLRAADRIWDTDPGQAREHVRGAAVAEHNLAEGGSLEAALRAMGERESGDSLAVRIQIEGTPVRLPAGVEAAVFANRTGRVREYPRACRCHGAWELGNCTGVHVSEATVKTH
ncbi:histidine kinase dimerization/phosphoacceptor domain-containing protein [Nocardia sp. CDC160]|uniref:histidine kinase dimerization/phosphoacceptor domain-containing protein n=1 Tax=Nocardia sp. CDC160 TaxID=3112166 RepID=UPI002DBC4906|nr:histidine kinase dimerization/phosphoacceptor domain-containing protein [Nocardia sp. CDC160]MEC3918424.1 histidine kinase dimerization/phosphoacceptor domain-containing protein [Nocardia sp. CDC160]